MSGGRPRSLGANPLAYRPLRAPKGDRSSLIQPPLDAAGELLRSNHAVRESIRYDFGGVDAAELSRQARRELIAEALRWTSAYRDVALAADTSVPALAANDAINAAADRPLLLAGHQPQLFHSGVWLKNFALATLAKRHGATAVNLIVDSDTVKSASLRVPGGTTGRPSVALVPLDEPGPVIPFEERAIVDRNTFGQFGSRAARQIGPLVAEPLLRRFWPMALQRSKATDRLGDCLAQARHQVEGQWGFETLEVPQSRVCGTASFARFTAHLFDHLPRLLNVYNAAVREYRRVHGIRSTAHPVPDLALDGTWYEAPYWIWTSEDPRRRRLFVRRDGARLRLTDRKAVQLTLPASVGGDVSKTAERLHELASGNVRIRSRALVTTLFARLVLGDVFLHGIGGAKYDQLTDAICERFFGVAPPGYMVLSATLLLPGADRGVSPEAIRAIDSQLRQLSYHPEAFLDGAEPDSSPELSSLVETKRRWVATPQTPENATTRWREFTRVNAAMQRWVGGQRDRLLARRAELTAALSAQNILAWREYAFCLYPEGMLREFFTQTVGG